MGMRNAEPGVVQVFSEIEELAGRCRFQNCSHTTEPGCAVLEALTDGSLPERRLGRYRKLLRENQHFAARTDARLRAEMRREWKKRSAAGRMAMQAKRGPQAGGRH